VKDFSLNCLRGIFVFVDRREVEEEEDDQFIFLFFNSSFLYFREEFARAPRFSSSSSSSSSILSLFLGFGSIGRYPLLPSDRRKGVTHC